MCESDLSGKKVVNLESRRNRQRTKIWELDSHFHCSIIGTCLSLPELKKIAQKMAMPFPSDTSDYDIHCCFVDAMKRPNPISRRVQKLLDGKYHRFLQEYPSNLRPESIETQWSQSRNCGEVAGALWAVTSHPNASHQLKKLIFGDMHMLSHLSGVADRIDRQIFTNLRKKNQWLETQLLQNKNSQQLRIDKKNNEIQRLRLQLENLQTVEKQLKAAQQLIISHESNEELLSLRSQCSQLNNDLHQQRQLSQQLDCEAQKWASIALEQEKEIHALKKRQMTLSMIHKSAANDAADDESTVKNIAPKCPQDPSKSCRNANLCGKKILYVGGRANQCAHFKTVVEKCNGSFVYHDGGMEDGYQKLHALLGQADAVLCPIDCVSHNAMKCVRQHCHKKAKPLVLLPRTSLNAFNKGLQEVISVSH